MLTARLRRAHEHGASMIEALVALAVLCLGMLGLGQLMARQLAADRVNAARAVALQHIDLLRDSMALNTAAVRAGDYALQWTADRSASADCMAVACTARQIADHDLAGWRASLRDALPGSRATVFPGAAPGQWGIAVAWPEMSRSSSGGSLEAPAGPPTGVDCPPTYLCHVAYVQP